MDLSAWLVVMVSWGGGSKNLLLLILFSLSFTFFVFKFIFHVNQAGPLKYMYVWSVHEHSDSDSETRFVYSHWMRSLFDYVENIWEYKIAFNTHDHEINKIEINWMVLIIMANDWIPQFSIRFLFFDSHSLLSSLRVFSLLCGI